MSEELVVIAIVIIVLTAGYFLLARLKKPLFNYVRILAVTGLLIMTWFFADNAHIAPKLILTAIALVSVWRDYFSLKKLQLNK